MKVKRILTTIDTHTAGGPTRTITGGLPVLRGDSVAEKMEYFETHFDPIRTLLMHEPRGHRDMSGAVITEATDPEADIGVFFLTAAGYLPACVHSSIGVAKAGLEAGFIRPPPHRPDGAILMETPSGLISLIPEISDGSVTSLALRPPPAFVHTPTTTLAIPGRGTVQVSVAFSGVFFVLVDVEQLEIGPMGSETPLTPENAEEFVTLGVEVLEAASRSLQVGHPDHPGINSIPLVMFYQEVGERHGRDIVISRSGGVDRSPCGAGTGAKLAYLFTEGRLGLGEEYFNDSFLDTRFTGKVLEEDAVGPYKGCLPEVKGSAFITGMHQFVLDADDPHDQGFLF